jgi:hypothetical protein
MRCQSIVRLLSAVAALTALLAASPTAHAIPAFARKYGTSCQTCHTIFPKLTPFGEAFRRNGFKFPGKDEDYIKQETVPLGQEVYRSMFPDAVWPGTLPSSSPLALGANGTINFHPDTGSGAAQADNGTPFTLQDLVVEAHLWAGGSFSEHISYYGEVTFSTDGTVDVEHAELHFNDLFGPRHLFNLYVGRGFPNLTSFGPHSSYVADTVMPSLSVTGLYGATSDSFGAMGQYNLIELNGMGGGRFIYSIGINSGSNLDVRTTENVYGHVGLKLGGMRLDGEGDTQGNASKPWAENAVTLDAFGYRSASHFQPAATAMTPPGTTPAPLDDLTYLVGGHVRGTWGSFELDAGIYYEWHNHATADGTAVEALVQYDEVSYVILPWLVPAFRLEYAQLRPSGGAHISDLKIIPGVNALIRPNLKLQLLAQIEHADGVPDGGWGAWGGSAAPMMGSVTEVESIQLGVAYAF